MIVTALNPDPRAPERIVVDLDGQRFATLSAAAVVELGLAKGLTLDGAHVDRLTQVADREAAYRVAIRLLSSRSRSAAEVRKGLRQRGHRDPAVGAAIERLQEQGVIDDPECARHYVRVRAPRGYGGSRLLRDLLRRGLDRQVAEAAITEVLCQEDIEPLERARALATRRARQLGALDSVAQRRRLTAFLARRGFHGREVNDLVGRLISEGRATE